MGTSVNHKNKAVDSFLTMITGDMPWQGASSNLRRAKVLFGFSFFLPSITSLIIVSKLALALPTVLVFEGLNGVVVALPSTIFVESLSFRSGEVVVATCGYACIAGVRFLPCVGLCTCVCSCAGIKY